MGTLTRKTLRQPIVSVRNPPTVGPRASPRVATAVHNPMAFAFTLASGNAALTIASEATFTAAAAAPCIARATTRNGVPGARPHAADASVNTTRATT